MRSGGEAPKLNLMIHRRGATMNHLLKLNALLASLLLTACVTINVYFPAGAAERAADQIIDSVIKGAGVVQPGTPLPPATVPPPRTPAGTPTGTPSTTAPGSALTAAGPTMVLSTDGAAIMRTLVGRLLELAVPVAHAQPQANIDVSSAEIRAITASMQSRFAQLERFFDGGVVGLTAEGLIDVRDIGSASLPDRALVKRLVAEDNRDRDALYDAIARENGRPEWEPDIRRIFAQRWVERGAKPGWYFRDLEGNWKQR